MFFINDKSRSVFLRAEWVLGSASTGGYGRPPRLDVSAAQHCTHLLGGLRQTPMTLSVLAKQIDTFYNTQVTRSGEKVAGGRRAACSPIQTEVHMLTGNICTFFDTNLSEINEKVALGMRLEKSVSSPFSQPGCTAKMGESRVAVLGRPKTAASFRKMHPGSNFFVNPSKFL